MCSEAHGGVNIGRHGLLTCAPHIRIVGGVDPIVCQGLRHVVVEFLVRHVENVVVRAPYKIAKLNRVESQAVSAVFTHLHARE